MRTNANDMENDLAGIDLVTAKEEIVRLKQSLRSAQNELLQYAHVASHDLQEPLRKILVYSGILHDRGNLPVADKEIVDKIMVSSGRMSNLISGLLSHSQAVASNSILRPVDLNLVVATIVEDFELAIKERGATIDVDKLPVIRSVALQMNQLFYNLIDNALKFSDPLRRPRIEIRCKKLALPALAEYITWPKAGKTYFDISVRDNGIGFNVQYAEQILKVFKRLHPKDMYPGSGIGLSICQSVLAHHDGEMYIESMPGEGSAFHIIISE